MENERALFIAMMIFCLLVFVLLLFGVIRLFVLAVVIAVAVGAVSVVAAVLVLLFSEEPALHSTQQPSDFWEVLQDRQARSTNQRMGLQITICNTHRMQVYSILKFLFS